MFRKQGWAAFLASLFLLLLSHSAAAANSIRPTFACFSPDNAAAIGRLGADNQSVRYGFEAGECLALAPGLEVYDVERFGVLWRFRILGAEPFLFAADWGAGFQPALSAPSWGFERYLPITSQLLARGRALIACIDSSNDFAARYDDFERRYRAYEASSRTDTRTGLVLVLYLSDTGPKLAAEREQLMRQAADLERRCGPYRQMEADEDFIAFVRTARLA